MKNKPNFIHNAPTKHAKNAIFTPIFPKKNTNFSKKSQKIPALCQLLKLTHLTPCTSKAYINIYPAQRSTGHGSRVTNKYAKQTQFEIKRP